MFTVTRVFVITLLLTSGCCAAEFTGVDAINQTGLDVFRRIDAGSGGRNLAISPFSIETGLALAYAGSDGVTRNEMSRAIHLPANDEVIAKAFQSLRASLARAVDASEEDAKQTRSLGGSQDVIRWNVANRLYGQDGYAFRPAFLALLRDRFDAPFTPMDFIHRSSAELDAINAWVATQTHNRIPKLLPPDSVTTNTRLVLVNALYLKAPWQSRFEKADTKRRAFHFADGTAHEVRTMYRTGWFGYANGPHATVVTVPYAGRELECVIILPHEGITPEQLLTEITPAHFRRWSQLGDRDHGNDVSLYLPSFRISGGTLRLGAALRAMGMRSAFDDPAGSADFDRIAPRRPGDALRLSDVLHQTFVAVDEEGTEAAAATATTVATLGVETISERQIEVHVDRPFLFAVVHQPSGACLFFGRVGDPR